MIFGFSTGSLAKGDFHLALEMLRGHGLEAVELSALREEELPELLNALETLELSEYKHVSIHAPSKLNVMKELELITLLAPLSQPIVVHPDVIEQPENWKVLGARLLIENMDKRKPVGRTASDLESIFSCLPEARLCLDVGHSKQVDPSLHETSMILRQHGHRLAEIHLSEVNSASGHERLHRTAIEDFKRIASRIPPDVPVILETPIAANEIEHEVSKAQEIFGVLGLVRA